MLKSVKKVTAILVALCLAIGGVGIAPNIASTSGSPIAKAAVKKYTRYVKPATLKVYKKAKTSSKVVATLKKDKKVVQYGSANKKGWVKIRYKSGKYGYVKKKNLKKRISKSGFVALAESHRNKIISAARKHNYDVDTATEVSVTEVKELGTTLVEFAIVISNNKYSLEFYEFGVVGGGVIYYNIYLAKGNEDHRQLSGEKLSAVLSYIEKYATT